MCPARINAANILMTVPSIALFGLMLPFLSLFGHGLGKVPAVIALILYSLLPIIRNTYIGIKNVPSELVEAGKGIGMGGLTRLREIEIPMAIPVMTSFSTRFLIFSLNSLVKISFCEFTFKLNTNRSKLNNVMCFCIVLSFKFDFLF